MELPREKDNLGDSEWRCATQGLPEKMPGELPCKPIPPKFRGEKTRPLSLGGGVSKAFFEGRHRNLRGESSPPKCRGVGLQGNFRPDYQISGNQLPENGNICGGGVVHLRTGSWATCESQGKKNT